MKILFVFSALTVAIALGNVGYTVNASVKKADNAKSGAVARVAYVTAPAK